MLQLYLNQCVTKPKIRIVPKIWSWTQKITRPFTRPNFGEIKFKTFPCSGSCGKLQLHLSRPAVTNSLPCPAPLQVGEQIIEVLLVFPIIQHTYITIAGISCCPDQVIGGGDLTCWGFPGCHAGYSLADFPAVIFSYFLLWYLSWNITGRYKYKISCNGQCTSLYFLCQFQFWFMNGQFVVNSQIHWALHCLYMGN